MQLKESVKPGVQILVVDDEAIVRRSITMLLEHDGHNVCSVESGEAALEQLTQRTFDLIITDFSMPGIQGDQLVARIRQRTPTQPIIMATAFVEDYKIFGETSGRVDALLRVLAADVRKWDTDGGSGLRLDIFPLSQPVYPQADRADGSARVVG